MLSTKQSLRDGLISAEAIRPELDRGLQILLPSQASQRVCDRLLTLPLHPVDQLEFD